MSKTPASPSSESTAADAGIQRWTANRKAAVVLDLIRGKTTAAETARLHGLTVREPSGARCRQRLEGYPSSQQRLPLAAA